MSNLKELRGKIGVVQSTRKVTTAMKLVAGVKFRKAELKVHSSREYASAIFGTLSKINRSSISDDNATLLSGRKNAKSMLVIVFSSDRGLCGNFNHAVLNKSVEFISQEAEKGKMIKVVCVGSKLLEPLNRVFGTVDGVVVEYFDKFYNGDVYENASIMSKHLIRAFHDCELDEVVCIFTKFYSNVKRSVEALQLVPVNYESCKDSSETIFEPSIINVLDYILPLNITVQIYQAALESVASEQCARMTSMDNATRNADELLDELSIRYNRTRQYMITQELMEIISGANAIAKE